MKTAGAEVEQTRLEQKQVANVIAALALRGHAVHELADGGFITTRWGMARHCPGFTELKAFARQIGAVHEL
jgi:hypothetical protein